MEGSRDEYKAMKQHAPTPHVHAKLIKLWADGAMIQYHSTDWKDCTKNQPSWDPATRYRVKPNTLRYRNFLMKSSLNKDYRVIGVCTEVENKQEPREQQDSFLHWLGGWQEVET